MTSPKLYVNSREYAAFEQGGYNMEHFVNLSSPSWVYDEPRFKAHVLGQFPYTPQDELRDRLNDGLQGKEPALPINTRYWRS